MSYIHFLSLKFTLLMYSKQQMKQGIILLILGSITNFNETRWSLCSYSAEWLEKFLNDGLLKLKALPPQFRSDSLGWRFLYSSSPRRWYHFQASNCNRETLLNDKVTGWVSSFGSLYISEAWTSLHSTWGLSKYWHPIDLAQLISFCSGILFVHRAVTSDF